jgi:iron complex outermembrane recepter protein
MTFDIRSGGAKRRAVLMGASSALAMTASTALAQTVYDAPQAAVTVDEIVVTGSVIQNRAEINARQRSTAIIDTLSSDEIGALPDVTIAESMRRIAGVTTIYNDDIGQFASVRGLHPDLIPVQFNGMGIASTGDLGEGSRKINLQVIPGEAVGQIQAYKTLSPDLDAGALGGLINLVPLSAFDSNERTLLATVGTSYSTDMDVPDINSWGHGKDSPFGYNANLLFSDRFGVNDNIGLTISGAWSVRPRTQTNSGTTGRSYYTADGAATTPESADWNGLAVPTQFISHYYTNRFEKFGGTARLEFRPNEWFETSLLGFAYFSDEQETRNSNRLFSLDQPLDTTEDTGTARVRSADTQWRYNTFERDQYGVQWGTNAQVGMRGELSTNLAWSRATFSTERPFVSFLYRPNLRLSYDLNQDIPYTLDDPAAFADPSNYALGNTYHDWREAESDLWEGRVDYAFNNRAQDRGWGFAAGADYRRMDMQRDNFGVNYEAGGLTLDGLEMTVDAPGWFPDALWIDADTFWGEVIQSVAIDETATDSTNRRDDYFYEEDVLAVYAAATYNTDRMSLSGGLRFDAVDFDATMALVNDGVLMPEPTTATGDYDHVLPYFNAVVRLTPSMRLKFGASQTLGRPNPEMIATVYDADYADLQITMGNPDLQPRLSTNLDLGFEWFFNGGDSMFTATLFHKDIEDDILEITSQEIIDGDTWFVTRPLNGETTTYRGLELGFVKNSFGDLHRWLGNLGASANAMWVDGETTYLYDGERRVRNDLLYQADFAGNAAVFYGFNDGSELRLAYNRQGRYVEGYGANPWQDNLSPPFDTLDLTAKWAVNEQWQLRLEGRNVLSNNRERFTGPNHEYKRTDLEIGSSWFLRATFAY